MKNLLALAVVSCTIFLIPACGGGSGGSSSSGVNTEPPAQTVVVDPPAQPTTPPRAVATVPLPETVTGADGTQLSVYLYATRTITMTQGSSSITLTLRYRRYLNPAAVNRYYSTLHASDTKISARGVEFLSHYDAGPAVGVNDEFYSTTANDANGLPILKFYELLTTEVGNSVTFTGSVPAQNQLSAGRQITVDLGGSGGRITLAVQNTQLQINGRNLNIESGYEYSAYVQPDLCRVHDFCNVNLYTGVNYYMHFIKAEYVALGLTHFDTRRVLTGDDSSFSTFDPPLIYGVLTPYENIPNRNRDNLDLVNVSYNINYAIGRYRDRSDTARDTLLSGSGRIEANFTDDVLKLDLDVLDHNGQRFVTIRDVEMHLAADSNEFSLRRCTSGSSPCSGSFDYADSTGISDVTNFNNFYPQVGGSFYGSNAEEIGGGIQDDVYTGGNYGEVGINFIGKQE